MNIIRKTLLKLARGVAREDVPAVPLPAPQIVRADRPVEKIKIGRSIGPGEYKVFPIEDIISYSKWEMAQEIGEKMQELGMIRYQVQEPPKAPDRLYCSDLMNEVYTITAEAWAVRKE